jgi:hypothetical protein
MFVGTTPAFITKTKARQELGDARAEARFTSFDPKIVA